VSWLCREGVVRRIVDGALRGSAPVIFGGPGAGKTTLVEAAAARLREQGVAVVVHEHPDDDDRPRAAEGAVCLRTGGIALHRALVRARAESALDGRPLQRVPLVPLLRRDLRAWAAAAGYAFSEGELELAFRLSGGHPFVFAAFLDACRFTRQPAALETRVAKSCEALFARIDRELAHPELAPLWDWIAKAGSAGVEEMRRRVGATKPALDRLVIAGPVSRTLGAKAEIAASCELYLRHRAR
jgi:hypothetical protein